MLKNKESILIEFFGLPASGKTTLCNLLSKELEIEGIKVLIRERYTKKFKKENKFYYKYILSIILNPKRSMLLLFFCLRNFRNFYCPEIHNTILKKIKRITIVSQILLLNLVLLSKNKKILLWSEGLFQSLCLTSSKINFNNIFKLYPRFNLIYVFVDSNHLNSYGRMKKRKKFIYLKKSIETKGDFGGIDIYRKASHNYKDLYAFLNQRERRGEIKKVIKINSEKPIRKNILLLKKELIKLIVQ